MCYYEHMKYEQDLLKILDGASINSQAKLAGCSPSTLWRALVKHPDYDKAKAAGKLHVGRIPAKLEAMHNAKEIVDEVLNGGTTIAVAAKWNMPVSSLSKLVHKMHPGISLANRRASTLELAVIAQKKAEKAAQRAKKLAELVNSEQTEA
jgi:hypothetical protein